MVTLKELGKNDYSDDFEEFWKGVLFHYRRVPKTDLQAEGSKKESWAKYQQLKATPGHVPLLLEQIKKMVDLYINQSTGPGGYSNRLPHVRTWLNQQRFNDVVPDYAAPVEIKKKLATDRPPPIPIETVKHKEYSKEERAKMQAGFKEIKKGVRKYV